MRTAHRRIGVVQRGPDPVFWKTGKFIMNARSCMWAAMEGSPSRPEIPHKGLVEALDHSGLVQGWSRLQVDRLAELAVLRILPPGVHSDDSLDDASRDGLVILLDGDVAIDATVEGESISLHLQSCGDVGRAASFAGSGALRIRTRLTVRRTSTLLLLQRSRLEGVRAIPPVLMQRLLGNLALHVHGVARRSYADTEQLRQYLFGAAATAP